MSPERPLPPRGLSRKEAADYLGIGTELLDRAAEAGVLPQPRKLMGKRIWDRVDLDRALDELPHWTADGRRRDAPSNDNPDAAQHSREAWLAETQ
jgi:predicted DNA-binding transcriptional regulator AlpA